MTPGELGGVGVMTLLRLVIPKLFTSCGRTAPGLACIHGVIGGAGRAWGVSVNGGLSVPVNPGGGGE